MNDKEIEIFAGARVRDVVLKFSKQAYKSTLSGQTTILDKNNNPVDLEGEVSENQQLYLSYPGNR